jgi:hypothetical protein
LSRFDDTTAPHIFWPLSLYKLETDPSTCLERKRKKGRKKGKKEEEK